MGAYDVLERLKSDGEPSAPITVYRVLDTLMEAGVVHKLPSLNAFVACPGHEHREDEAFVFLNCSSCGTWAETDAAAISAVISQSLQIASFKADKIVVEVSGTCAICVAKG
jgi:Fur family transcriptional regulator, zinc uptake regulator